MVFRGPLSCSLHGPYLSLNYSLQPMCWRGNRGVAKSWDEWTAWIRGVLVAHLCSWNCLHSPARDVSIISHIRLHMCYSIISHLHLPRACSGIDSAHAQLWRHTFALGRMLYPAQNEAVLPWTSFDSLLPSQRIKLECRQPEMLFLSKDPYGRI